MYKFMIPRCNLWPTYILLLINISVFLTVGGCATPDSTIYNPRSTIEDLKLVWPPPPQTPRIQYIKSISGSADIGVKKSWFKKAIDTIFGRDMIQDMMLRPYGVFADSKRIYVTDPGLCLLHVFDIQDKRYFQIKKVNEEALIAPIGIVVDKNGEIYLSDSELKRILVFDREGRYLREIGSTDMFIRPAGVTIDEERIYVVDTHGHHVLVFKKKDGKYLFSFGKNGSGKGDFNYPTNIFMSKERLLYITDSLNFRVQIFDRDGNYLSSFGKLGDGTGDFSKPKGIAVNSEGHVYVADAHFDNIQIFDRDGRLLLAFGNTGRSNGEMILPAGLFIDEKDKIYVADSYNNRIQIFQYLKEQE